MHRSICLLVTVISLEKMLLRHKTMFAVVSAGVWGRNSLNNSCGYRVQLVLPFFFCTPPSMRDSLFVLASYLPLFVGKTQKTVPVLRGTGFFFFTPPLERDSHFAVALRLPPFDRKTLKNCACSADPGLLNETNGSWFPLSCLSSYQNGW